MSTVVIAAAASCERAAKVAGRPYGGNVTIYAMPLRCVWYSTGGSFFFNNAYYYSGYVPSSAQPVCAGAPRFCIAATSTEGKA
jgi:hypothetical protein